MADSWSFLLDLVITVSAALFLGVLFEKLKQSAILGYLIAGTVVGPSAAGWVSDPQAVLTLSELGVALLLFTIGLEFSWRRLLRLGKIAFFGGTTQILLVLLVTAGAALALGYSLATAVTLGAVFSLASTAIVIRILKDINEIDSTHGKSSIGVLLMQDIAVVPLVMLVTLMGGGSGEKGGKGSVAIGELLLNTTMLIGALLLLVTLILPRLLNTQSFARNRELPILTAIATCMAATWGAHAAGLSPALGAFLAGMLLAETRFAEQIRSDVFPLKTLFVTLFFSSIGMVLDVQFTGQNFGIVMAGVIVVMIGKALLTFLAVRPFSPSIVASIATGIALSQVGEFSFVLAKIGSENGLLSPFLFQWIISVSVLSLLLTPAVVVGAPKWARRIAVALFDIRKVAEGERMEKQQLNRHLIVVGYGEAGQRAAQQVTDSGRAVLIMDINPALLDQARSQGFHTHLGDATQTDQLLSARLPEACGMVVAVPDPRIAKMIVGNAKGVAPQVPVVARARYHVLAPDLDFSGADEVVDEEELVGERLGQRVQELARLRHEAEGAPAVPGHSAR